MKVSLYKKIGSLFFTTIVLIGAVGVVLQAQLIRDTFLYYQYEPSETIASFVEQTGMSDYGKFMFYASHPSLETAESFNEHCDKREHSAAVLGCYDGQNIFIYNITDPKLEGIRPTTAAHEMLHAGYKRLSADEKKKVDALVEAEFEKLKDNVELAGRMEFYSRTQPGDQDNELHSIIGTEIEVVGTELEEYYGKYFSDRSKVVAQHKKYNALFEELRLRAEALTSEIDQIASNLEKMKASYESQAGTLQSDIASFNRRASQGEFESQSEFNRERQSLVARSTALEGLRIEINTTISRYNSLVNELNSIATETNALNRSIDSSLEPAPSL